MSRTPGWRDDLADVADSDAADFDTLDYRRQLAQRAPVLMQADFAPATWKACLEMVVHDRPASAVAQELGLSVNAVYLAKARVLRRLREELRGRWE